MPEDKNDWVALSRRKSRPSRAVRKLLLYGGFTGFVGFIVGRDYAAINDGSTALPRTGTSSAPGPRIALQAWLGPAALHVIDPAHEANGPADGSAGHCGIPSTRRVTTIEPSAYTTCRGSGVREDAIDTLRKATAQQRGEPPVVLQEEPKVIPLGEGHHPAIGTGRCTGHCQTYDKV